MQKLGFITLLLFALLLSQGKQKNQAFTLINNKHRISLSLLATFHLLYYILYIIAKTLSALSSN